MKHIYFILSLLFFSCGEQNSEQKGAIEIQEAENAVDAAAEQIEAAVEPSEGVTIFREELQKLKVKSVPLVDSTSLGSFKDKSDYQNINAEALKLSDVNWNNSKFNYHAISAYRLNLSKDFHTIVVTVLQNDDIIESRLINYDLYGNVIASEMIAYDEMVESWARSKATIEADRIIHHYQYTVNEDDEPDSGKSIVKIEANGNLRLLGIRDICYDLVIKDLNLNHPKLIPKLQAFKILPNSPNEAVVVIPEIAEGSEEEGYFELNAHIAFVNIENEQVLYHYFESAETNGWISDAIMLKEITVDTAPYTIIENERAFGIKTHFVGSSRVNPYKSDRLSLYIIADNSLQNVLHNYEVNKGTGGWDGDCEGEFASEEKTLIILEERSNGYFDIMVKSKITNSIAFKDENGDCDSKDTITTKTSVLKFDGITYQ
ncbi:PA3715 family protein [Echinicola shivajiensis]|uniref:hypothetical protein n=1 Tax=Echinicola shivajiensis TaxID=1035916 RepID=UPI001BFCC043|nr:hypothetical protein [Echinicola shivajiensis]